MPPTHDNPLPKLGTMSVIKTSQKRCNNKKFLLDCRMSPPARHRDAMAMHRQSEGNVALLWLEISFEDFDWLG